LPDLKIATLKAAQSSKTPGAVAVEVQNLEFKSGCTTALIGPNGSGKSTIVNGFMGFRPDVAFEASLDGTVYANTPPPNRELLGFASQRQSFPPGLKVSDLVAFHRRAHGLGVPHPTASDLEPRELMGQIFDKMSGGQKQRLNLFLALGHGPELAVIDEPESSLDEKTIGKVRGCLQARTGAGLTSIVATHNAEVLSAAQEAVLIESGQVSFQGSLESLLQERLGAGVLEIVFEDQAERVRLMNTIAQSRERKLIVATDPLRAMVFGTQALKDIVDDPGFGGKRMGLSWRSVTTGDLLLSLHVEEVHLPPVSDGAEAFSKSP